MNSRGGPHQSEKISHQVQRDAFIEELRAYLPEQSIVHEQEALRVFECDALAAYQCLPWLVLLPETTDQVQAIVKLCHQQGVPVVARGAGTGLAGGALPLDNGVLLSLSRFSQIVEIDVDNRLARVQPGVRNLAVSQAAQQYGLYYAPDPSSQIACSIGGNVAENSGGVHCLKYGLTTHNVLRLKVVMMNGELVTIGSHALDSTYYDLLALMTGSEGMLGIIVEVSVRLLPIPEHAQVILAAFDEVAQAGRAVASVIASGLLPAGLELMDKAATRAVEDFVHAGYPLQAEAILLCEMDGMRETVEAEIGQAVELFHQLGASEVRVSQNEQQRQLMWAGRKAAFPAVGRISSDYYCMDGTIPRRHLASVLQQIAELSNRFCLRVVNVFHAGDGNLHPLILYDASQPGEMDKAELLGGEILRLSIAVGGTITGEHGVGVEKINYMCEQFNAAELDIFHQVKQVFDEKGLLNPGKAVPSLHRCAEFGAMHVHEGKVDFPELERF